MSTKDIAPAVETGEKKLKLDYNLTFRVGLAFAIIMLFWNAYDFVIPLLLEHVYGLPNWARGLIMGLDNLLSLFMLPLFGGISDRATGKLVQRFGRRTPFIIIGTLCTVALMIFVPVVTINQQKKTDAYKAEIDAKLNDDTFMEPLLEGWYDDAEAEKAGSKNFCDIAYLNKNKSALFPDETAREFFTSIRFDAKLTSKKPLLGGTTTYFYDGEKVNLEDVGPGGKTYKEISEGNAIYKQFVAAGMNNYKSERIHAEFTTTKKGVGSLAVYMVILLLVLIAMATFRSPAVALMPDVTPKPLRSPANAVINLMGGIGGAIGFLIYTVVLFGQSLYNYVIIFASVAAGMLLLLGLFLSLVKERKLVARCQEICKEYGIDDFDADENPEAAKFAEELIEEGEGEGEAEAPAAEAPEEKERRKILSPKEWWNSKTEDEKSRLKSLWLLLASIFMWFMGYNAVSSNLSVYTTKALNLKPGVASIISGISMGISAIAFIPVGYLAGKLGRRKTIMIGFALAVVSFVLIFLVVKPGDNWMVPAALYALFYLIAGFGLIIANVNTFPMVTELSTASTVGKYTGYYYVATMSAQSITPMLGGLVMDYVGEKYLFLYSALCVVASIVLMVFVKHGDSKPVPKKSRLEQFGDMADND